MGSTLTADDYLFFSTVNNQSTFTSLANYGSEIGGRYSFAITIIASIKLFGIRALEILPAASLVLLLVGASSASIHYLKLINKKTTIPELRLGVAIAIFAVVSSLITAPSVFDTFVWFSAVPVYVTSFGVLFVAASILLKDLSATKIRLWPYVLAFILLLVASGYLEFIPIELVLTGTFTLIASLVFSFTKVPNKQSILKIKLRIVSLLLIVSGLIGGIILRFSPDTLKRIESGKKYTAQETLSVTINHLQLIPQFIFSWHVFFSIVLGILIYMCVGKTSSLKYRSIVLGLSIGLITIPVTIVGILAAVSGLTEATGMGSNRLLYVATTGILLGTSLLVYSVINLLASHLKSKNTYTLPLLLVPLVLISLVYGASSLSKVAQAVYVKKSMVQYREAVIQHDIETNQTTIRIMPASILLSNSQVNDIGFGSPKIEIWSSVLYSYYHIPIVKKLDFASEAPPGYCTTLSSSVDYGKQTCKDIVNSANGLQYTTYPL